MASLQGAGSGWPQGLVNLPGNQNLIQRHEACDEF